MARFGPGWFREAGTDEQPGTFLATVSGATPAPGVYETPCGVPLAHLVRSTGAVPADLQAVLVGGFQGAWLPPEALRTVRLTRSDLQPWGASVGAGVVMLLERRPVRLVVGRGACSHPDGTARFVASAMRVFADEVDLHLRGGCRAPAAR